MKLTLKEARLHLRVRDRIFGLGRISGLKRAHGVHPAVHVRFDTGAELLMELQCLEVVVEKAS